MLLQKSSIPQTDFTQLLHSEQRLQHQLQQQRSADSGSPLAIQECSESHYLPAYTRHAVALAFPEGQGRPGNFS